MEPKIPWYQSAIIRQQVVALIVAVLTLLGVTTDIDWDATVTIVFAAVAAIVPVITILSRLVKPTPAITDRAAHRMEEIRASQENSNAGS